MSTPLPIVLTQAQKKQIEAQGASIYPNECCGIIYGRDVAGQRIVEALEVVENQFEAGEQYHRFSITSKTLMQAERKCTDGRLVLGFYHSHPDQPAKPSEYDRVHGWPFYSYIIVAIHKKQPKDMTCWQLNETTEQFVNQGIVVKD